MTTNAPKITPVILLFLATVFFLSAGYFFTKDLPQIADENVHYRQILNTLERSPFTVDPYTVMIPGYHWTVALPSLILHDSRGATLRLTTTVLSFFCILAFYLLAARIDKASAVRRSLLFLSFPLFYPFFSLLYTDIYSMMFIYLSLLMALDRRLWLSGIIGVLSLLVRQNNIVWIAFIALVAYMENYFPQYRWKDVKPWLSKFFFYFLALALLIVFFIWNKGFVLGDRTHQPFSLNFNNLFLLLFLFFFLFLPFNIANFRKIVAFLTQHKGMWLVLAEVFLVFALFFKANHPYNQFGRFLHNWILFGMAGSFPSKCIFFIPIAYSILSLCVTPLTKRSFYLIYPFTILYLMPNAVTEIRYCFIPFSLFLALKEPDSPRISLFTLASYIVPVAIIMYLLCNLTFFP